MSGKQGVHEYIDANRDRFMSELFDFLRLPSVSANSEYKQEVKRTAEWVRDRMRDAGLEVSMHDTPGHPIVLGEWRKAGASAPTIMIYGHYDVQPPEPLDLWTSPPFEPEIRDGRIYARGSVDDKGQLYLHIKAIEALLETGDALPVNVIVVAEGEEEIGSVNLMPFVTQHRDRLKCDAIIISDTTMAAPGLPTIGASLRGLAYFEIHVQGSRGDLHSGSYGGSVLNPATALAHIIASFHDEHWHVAIDGFYDDVADAAEFRESMKRVPVTDQSFLDDTGSPKLVGEKGYTTLERIALRPTCEVNGLLSGYTGEGSKTVLPAKAMAKVSFRLVPDQNPHRVKELLEAHVKKVTPEGVTARVVEMHGGMPWRARIQGPLYEAAAKALEEAYNDKIVYLGEGGSIPIVPEFEKVLGAPVLLMGFGLPGENAHAPDEWMSVDNYEKGTHASASLLQALAAR